MSNQQQNAVVSELHHRAAVIVGVGGTRFGLGILDPDAVDPLRFVESQVDGAAYAVQGSVYDGAILLGTKTGCVGRILPTGSAAEAIPSAQSYVRVSGGVLSLTELDETTVAVSDTGGTISLCDLVAMTVRPLPLSGILVSGLMRVGGHEFVGIGSDGQILRFAPPDYEATSLGRLAPPPEQLALVRGVYWSSGNALAWPVKYGRCGLLDLSTYETRVVATHRGELYALATAGPYLLTIGSVDAMLRLWQAGEDGPLAEYPAPAGIVAAACVGAEPLTLVTVDLHGCVYVHVLDKQGLHAVRSIEGNAVRSLHVPQQKNVVEALDRRYRATLAKGLAAAFTERVALGQTGQLEELHEGLIAIGHERTSIALQAHEANRRQDVLAEIRWLRDFMGHAGETVCDPGEWYAVYAHRAEQVGAYDAAYTAWQNAFIANPDIEPSSHLEMLQRRMDHIATGDYVIEADAEFSLVAEAWTIMGRPLTGRWLINVLGRWDFEIDCPASVIVSKYDVLRSGPPVLPPACCRPMWRLSADGVMESDGVIVSLLADDIGVRLECDLAVRQSDGRMIAAMIVVLDIAPSGVIDTPVGDWNARLARRACVASSSPLAAEILSIANGLTLAAQRAKTERWPRRW